jgi:hypothetical protein
MEASGVIWSALTLADDDSDDVRIRTANEIAIP